MLQLSRAKPGNPASYIYSGLEYIEMSSNVLEYFVPSRPTSGD